MALGEIYVVTRGEYSDYNIVGVFDTLQAAQVVAKSYTSVWDDARVETFRLNVAKQTNENHVGVYVDYATGEVVSWCCGGPDLPIYTEMTNTPCIFASGETKDQALKIARDYRAKHMAETMGL